MSWNTNPYGPSNSIQNDRQVYLDFMENQKRLRENYAGAASNNNVSQIQYGGQNQDQFKKHREQEYKPNKNRFNIFQRDGARQIPKTRDRFVANAFSQLIAPQIADKRKEVSNERYHHDKLNVSDIHGTNPNTYGRLKNIEGRNVMDLGDIERSRPNMLK